jgi:hypothetical protein
MTRRWMAPLVLLLLAASGGCGSETSSPDLDGEPGIVDEQLPGGAGTTVPDCPLTAEQASTIVDRPLTDQPGCSFGDGIALLSITTASEEAALMTYDYERNLATQTYDTVRDLARDGTGFFAVKDIEAQLVLIRPDGAYTIVMSSFGMDAGQYEQTMYDLVDAILAGGGQ